MKNAVKKLLNKMGLLEKLRYHPLNRIYRNKLSRDRYFAQLRFYQAVLGRKVNLVFDIGANVGDTTHIFQNIARKVIALEPDDENYSILKMRFGNNSKVVIIKKAVSEAEGEAEFFIQEEGSAFNTLSDKWVNVLGDETQTRFGSAAKFQSTKKVKTTTLEALIKEFGIPDFIKIDVEGFEYQVVKSLQQPVQYISFECNLPEFKNETIQIVQYLDELNKKYRFNYHNDDQEFLLPQFVDAAEMTDIVSKTKLRYFEVFCQLN
jgi:FkbM family methyltransferase